MWTIGRLQRAEAILAGCHFSFYSEGSKLTTLKAMNAQGKPAVPSGFAEMPAGNQRRITGEGRPSDYQKQRGRVSNRSTQQRTRMEDRIGREDGPRQRVPAPDMRSRSKISSRSDKCYAGTIFSLWKSRARLGTCFRKLRIPAYLHRVPMNFYVSHSNGIIIRKSSFQPRGDLWH